MSIQGERELLKKIGTWIEKDYTRAPWHNSWRGSLLGKSGAILSALPQPPSRVLDAGCGSGYFCAFLHFSGYTAVGMDVCEDAVRLIRDRPDYAGWELHAHDWEKAFPGAPYDAIVYNDAFHHCLNKPAVMNRTAEALAPDGVAVFVEPGVGHARSARGHAAKYDVTETDTPPYQIVRLAKRAGFRAWRVLPHPETLSKTLYGPSGMLTHHPLVSALCRFSGLLTTLLIWGRWFHGMTVLSKSGKWPVHSNPMDQLKE